MLGSADERRTGSAFGWNATYAAGQVAVEGAYQSFTRGSDDGYWARHHFCPACGVTIWYDRGLCGAPLPVAA